MDLATIIGFVAGIGVVTTLILMGGSLSLFYDIHAVIVIFGGCTAATLIRFPFSALLHGFPMGVRFAFTMRSAHPRELIDEITRLAEITRKSGPVALESANPSDPFLERDRDNFLQRLDEGQKIYRAIGDAAPAWGMVGTLIGMVQMFANMSDASKLGPFMAISLLATLYGALVGNLICLPIADKLHLKLEEEDISRTLVIDGVLQIRDAKSPTVVREMLLAYLPHHNRDLEEAH